MTLSNFFNADQRRAVINEDRFMFTQPFQLNGTGTDNLNVDGSVTPQIFSITPPLGTLITVSQVIIYIEDLGHLVPHRFGHDIDMTNGLIIHRRHEGNIIATIPSLIKTNGDIAALVYDVNINHPRSDSEFMVAKWEVGRGIQGIVIDGNHNDSVEVQVRDDLTGLEYFRVTAQGTIDIRG